MIKECCKNQKNLEIKDSGKSDLVLMVCKVCSCRHFELTLDKGKLGVVGKAL